MARTRPSRTRRRSPPRARRPAGTRRRAGRWRGPAAAATCDSNIRSAMKRRTAGFPENQAGSGGIVKRTSSVSRSSSASTSAASHAATKRSTSARTPAVPQRGELVGLADRRDALADRRPRPLQRAVGRGDGGLEHLRGLRGRELEHVAQQQDGALVGRQVLERGDERQLDAVADRVGVLRQRLQPHRAGHISPRSLGSSSGATRSGVVIRRSRWRRHALVVTRYSQVRSAERPWKRSRPRQASSRASCSASSASCGDPSIR